MTTRFPSSTSCILNFRNGVAIGTSDRWEFGEYCKIVTPTGLVGCAIFDVQVADEFGDAIAIVKGSPDDPLVEPEQLLDARISASSKKAQALGVHKGMTGREAVERFLAVGEPSDRAAAG